MSITDELRDYAKCYSVAGSWEDEKLAAIADRIDAEHEAALKSLGLAQAERDEYLESIHLWEFKCSSMVELPRDADGKVINFGDVLSQFGKPMTVFAMSDPDPDQGDCMLNLIDDLGNDSGWVRARKMTHYHKPTLEDVLRECCSKYYNLLIESMSDSPHNLPSPSEIIDEYAEKVREVMGE